MTFPKMSRIPVVLPALILTGALSSPIFSQRPRTMRLRRMRPRRMHLLQSRMLPIALPMRLASHLRPSRKKVSGVI